MSRNIIFELMKKFHALYRTQKIATVLARTHQLTLSLLHRSTYVHISYTTGLSSSFLKWTE
jgi:hypothetical protein